MPGSACDPGNRKLERDFPVIRSKGTRMGIKDIPAFGTPRRGGTHPDGVSVTDSAAVRRVRNRAQKYPASAVGIATAIPMSTSWPIFAPIIPAAAVAPGWGGIKQCTE